MPKLLTMVMPEVDDVTISINRGPSGERILHVGTGDQLLLVISCVKGVIEIENNSSKRLKT